jgi:hypothetical protein
MQFWNINRFAAAIGLVICLEINAVASIVFDLGTVITGDSPASSATPWVSASINSAPANQVTVTLSAPNLTGNEDIKEWLFNVDPRITQAQLNSLYIVSKTLNLGSFAVNNVSLIKKSVDGVTRAGFSFDLDLGLPDGSLAKRFTRGDILQIVLGTTLPATTLTLTENTFNFRDDTGTYYSAAHVRNTTGPSGSGWIGTTPPAKPLAVVPEPSTVLAGGLLLLPFIAGAIRSFRRR